MVVRGDGPTDAAVARLIPNLRRISFRCREPRLEDHDLEVRAEFSQFMEQARAVLFQVPQITGRVVC